MILKLKNKDGVSIRTEVLFWQFEERRNPSDESFGRQGTTTWERARGRLWALLYLKHIERRTKEGVPVVETTLATKGAGYCIDSTEDVTVGVAIDGKLLVSSVCVAHNKALLKELGVTHVLNVAAGLSNAFPEARDLCCVSRHFLSPIGLCLFACRHVRRRSRGTDVALQEVRSVH